MENLQTSETSCSPIPLPYEVFASSYGYEFVTQDGAQYTLSFIKIHDTYPLYSFSIEKNTEKHHPDERVKATIISVLTKFFEQEYNAMLYTCDISDGKHFARFRLFTQWLMPFKDKYQREVYCVDDLLSSIIVRRDNPLAKDMINIFKDLYETTVKASH